MQNIFIYYKNAYGGSLLHKPGFQVPGLSRFGSKIPEIGIFGHIFASNKDILKI